MTRPEICPHAATIRVALAAVCFAGSLAVAGSLAAQERRSTDLGGLAPAPSKYLLTLGVKNPGHLLQSVCESLRGERDAAMDSYLRAMAGKARAELGLDIFDPAAWRAAGVDVDRSLRMLLADRGGWLGLPQTSLWTFGVADRAQLSRLLQEPIDGEVETVRSEHEIHASQGARVAWSFVGSTAYYLLAGAEGTNPAERLGEFLAETGLPRTIGSDQAYHRASQVLGAPAEVALYVNCAAWPDDGQLPPDFPVRSLLLALADHELVCSFEPSTGSRLTGIATGGTASKDFLARLDRPAFALTVSLARPVEALETIVAELMPKQVPELDEIREGLRKLGIGPELLDRQLGAGAGGCVLYPGADGMRTPKVCVFAKLSDPASVPGILAGLAEDGRVPIQSDRKGEGYVLFRPKDGAAEDAIVGVVGDYLVLGNAVDVIRRAALGEGAGYQPAIGGGELFACEIDLGSLSTLDPDAPSAELLGAGSAVITAAVVDGGLVVRGTLRGREPRRTLAAEVFRLIVGVWGADLAHETAPIEKTEADLAAIHAAATIYTLRNSKLPSVKDLLVPDERGHPYLEGGQPRDPWGGAYVIRELEGRLRFEVVSSGPDGIKGTGDDLAHPPR